MPQAGSVRPLPISATATGAPVAPGVAARAGLPPNLDTVSVLISTNSLFLQHAAVCLTSLLANNSKLFFDIVVVSLPTEKLDEDKLRRSLALYGNHSLRFRAFVPPSDLLLPLNPRAHYTVDTWARLWVEDFFPLDVNRVLYLDVDIVVVADIAPLWHTDLDGALLGSVDIPGSERGVIVLGLRPEDGYFNAGVLVIDLKQWRHTRALDTVLDYVRTYPDRLANVDQDALNACFHNRRKRLEYEWNVIRPFFREPLALPLSRSEIELVRREARIIHFNGGSKPWSYFSDHPRKDEYDKYLRMTEWRDFVPLDRTPLNRLRKGLSAVLPHSAKAILKGISRLR
jgi:lipopolysaccharide biosynthesis glycosyltransferase